MSDPFNPLDMGNLGTSIANRLLSSEPTPLGAVPAFNGAGIYAIYYNGTTMPCYEMLLTATLNGAQIPIYVGKAVPAGGRRGIEVEHGTKSRALSRRLGEHAKSVEAASNLKTGQFTCRWLVVEPIWIPLGESVIISRFTPVWNGLVDGFGNHDPGAGRRQGMRSRWDTLHPGRTFAPLFPERAETADQIAGDVEQYLAQRYQV